MLNTPLRTLSVWLKRWAPSWFFNVVRSVGTAIIGPIRFAYRSGYLRSAFKMSAVDKRGVPLPWYTYPSIDFLAQRDYSEKNILEFGGGQSTLWWAARSNKVLTLEGDQQWFEKIRSSMPENVDLNHVSMASIEENISSVRRKIEANEVDKYDVIVIDGLFRGELIPLAIDSLADNGVIVCDNAEGYGFYEGFKDTGFSRVDFFGNAPGVVLPHATSIYFKANAFVFDANFQIPIISEVV